MNGSMSEQTPLTADELRKMINFLEAEHVNALAREQPVDPEGSSSRPPVHVEVAWSVSQHQVPGADALEVT